MRNRTDVELMQLVIDKQHPALEELYDRYVKLVFSFAMKSIRDEQAAREIVQLVFIRLWTIKKGFDENKGHFVNWIITITRNITIDYLRKQRRQEAAVQIGLQGWGNVAISEADEPDSIFSRIWIGQQIRQAYHHLSESQVQLIEKFYWQGYSLSEISVQTNEPLGTIKSRLHQCLKILRKHLSSLREG
jgi:RNA polymerase sigma factor (sigma-70 family)